MQEEFFIKQVVEKKVLGPVLDVLIATMPRDNLLSSGALDLFEFIKKENVKDLVKHLVVNHREKLLSLSYMPTFRELLLRYDQTNGYTTDIDYFLDNDEDVGGRRLPSNARMMEHIAVDPSEEDYWNTSDPEEEDEQNGKLAEKTPATNGASTPSKPLVDYTSDEENDENVKDGPSSPVSNADSGLSGTPPERVSEKRRREEDDEDDLGKLLQQNKRRNSSSASSNAHASPQMKGQRRKSFSSGTGNGTPKKIAISLSPGLKTGGSRSDEDS
jgi:protein phosphatase 4 regulatory subunit 3